MSEADQKSNAFLMCGAFIGEVAVPGSLRPA
jgi:hypothetical protein